MIIEADDKERQTSHSNPWKQNTEALNIRLNQAIPGCIMDGTSYFVKLI